MAYRIVIELNDRINLPQSSNFFDHIIQMTAKKVGLVNVKSIDLNDKNYNTLLSFREGYALGKAVTDFNVAKEEEQKKTIEKYRSAVGGLGFTTGEEDKDAIN